MGPVLQLTRRGAAWREPEAALSRLRDEFDARHVVKLPALVEPRLLEQIHAEIERAEFFERAHGPIATELCMARNACAGLLHFLVNDRSMYHLIEEVSGCRPIRHFFGRVYRRLPNGRHHDSWHSDLHEARQIGMSVNLSAQEFEGGRFELRDADTGQVLASVANIGLGDAILFRVAPALEHRVTDVGGTFPKTAFAGWFGATRDYLTALGQDPFMRAEEET